MTKCLLDEMKFYLQNEKVQSSLYNYLMKNKTK